MSHQPPDSTARSMSRPSPSSLDPLVAFRLKPVRAARVSEVSETTAAAPVPDEERINFHIGNPLQDARLSSAFVRAALGIDIHRDDLHDAEPDNILTHLGWDAADRPKLEVLIRTVRKSCPYMPRGGFARERPHALIKAFCSWLENQQESLHYDTGEQTGKREIILASGGVHEALRVILFALSSHLEAVPARVLSYRYELDARLRNLPNLVFADLATDERVARMEIEQFLAYQPTMPTFLLIGSPLTEETRRKLRLLSIELPLFFIEANDTPNHQSLAREAKLTERVIRLLTPAIFSPTLAALSITFVAGNAAILSVIENVHFSLKGTPAASEVELLTYLLEQGVTNHQMRPPAYTHPDKPWFEGLALGVGAEQALATLVDHCEQRLDQLLARHAQVLSRSVQVLELKARDVAGRLDETWKQLVLDEFAAVPANDLIGQMAQNTDNPAWRQALERSFLSQFVKHQPQYRADACLVASGSSRTALGLLGFHCGIAEVVIPDLSWSYEQCFPTVHAVPLTPSLDVDAEAIIATVDRLCRADPSWPQRGAVVINNPHNATGRVFDEEALRAIVTYALQHEIYVVDDLAYQNVAPVDDLPEIRTVRQIAGDLVRLGAIQENQADRVITVHSLSKTDCLAGARLAVVEIPHQPLRQCFADINARIQPNLAAILICYLFYRSPRHVTRSYWLMRNAIFRERMQALQTAVDNLPADRNHFGLRIVAPTGSMYPLLQVEHLPAGLSLDWLSSSLARQGIGLLPLATFARTEKGFETARKTFRLTLGGTDGAEVLLAKTRRLLIDLNRLIADEGARYDRKELTYGPIGIRNGDYRALLHSWDVAARQIQQLCQTDQAVLHLECPASVDKAMLRRALVEDHIPQRLEVFRTRLLDRALISDNLMSRALSDDGTWLAERLEQELTKDSLQRRQELFRLRPYDRTVHPTQMFSLQAELALDALVTALVAGQPVAPALVARAARALTDEYLGRNVAVTARQEGDEMLLDVACLITSEEYAQLFADTTLNPLLSFWSDWDGSNRPSGQGHVLVAALVMENVQRMARVLQLLRQADPHLAVDAQLIRDLESLAQRNQRFTRLLSDITALTHQLEQRYRGILPLSVHGTPLQRLATRFHLGRDPAKVLWEHNDRYERRMLALRRQRRAMLEDYLGLNKRLRKQLHALIPALQTHRSAGPLLREVVGYRNLLRRIVITPRIHQGMITARDQFVIDTTVYNIFEINALGGMYGNPGLALALQISLSSRPEVLIALDRKMRMQGEQTRRQYPASDIASIWLIPLFEDIESVRGIRGYLDRVWEYAAQSRQTAQSVQHRFADIITEVFIAGSDLSQQASQATAAHLWRQAKHDVHAWLAEHGLAECVRVKLGSGEPMQRQGSYYSKVAGRPAFLPGEDSRRRFATHLPASARRSTAYAVTPLQGVHAARDLVTFQSNLSEHVRLLPARDVADLLYHVRESQREHRRDLLRAAESLAETRLRAQRRIVQELERLTIGTSDALYEKFLSELTDSFRHILFGREEDVFGIHIASYFIARSIPQLRDRPTSRLLLARGAERGQRVLANIIETIPLAKHGTLLRAIAHNQAQTVVLGLDQLSTGLFRALERFAQANFADSERGLMIAERVLPHLPVYEILRGLRLYRDRRGEFLSRIEAAFPAGNSAFVALREDSDAMHRFLPLLQQELLRRHGVNAADFFTDGTFIPDLLPTLRPDLAVLLQRDLFNTDVECLLAGVSGRVSEEWRRDVHRLLQLPSQIHHWRSIIWDVMGDSIYQRVQSFAELATALYTFSSTRSSGAQPALARSTKLSPALTGFLRTARPDDEMRHFLMGAIEYLSSFAEGSIEMPVSIIRAMNDIERIAQIEETALPPAKQELIRFCTLQVARLAGENG